MVALKRAWVFLEREVAHYLHVGLPPQGAGISDLHSGEIKNSPTRFSGSLSASAGFSPSGHEAAFAAFLCCLCKIGVLRVDDQIAIVFKVFNR